MKTALLIAALVVCIRLPFLNQAVQGDDVYYIAAAEHAQIDPLHPNHVHYLFEGRDVDFRGYPHPPLNAWCLAALIALFGAVREVPFHAVYIAFSLLAALSMYSLARRFSPHPVWATLLFIAVPAFVINGNSFESDIPFLAFWMAGIAAFVAGVDRRRGGLLALSVACLAIGSLAAVQIVFAVPILAVYAYRERSKLAWLAVASPVLAVAAWQTFEFVTSGQFPFAVAAGYQQSYHYQRLTMKLRNAGALAVHALFIVCPLLIPGAIAASGKRRDRDTIFLLAWIVFFFAGAVALFFAGSARYLLPMAAPVALLVSRLRPVYLGLGFAAQLTLSLLLAIVNYQHWDGYRQFARQFASEAQHRRVWVNAEWSLRYYLELEGARAVRRDQFIPPGDLLISSELADPAPLSHGGSVLVSMAKRDIRPAIPLRIIGLETSSAFSTDDKGFFPFGVSAGLIDRVHADVLQARVPAHENLLMGAPDADNQIVSGIYNREEGAWRWMGKQALILLKSPSAPTPIHIGISIPAAVPARTVTVSLDGKALLTRTFPAPGQYRIDTDPQKPAAASCVLSIAVDKTISPPGDIRELGLILTEAGFRK